MMFEQEKVLKSMIPIFPKQDIEERVGIPIPSPTIAAMYPFVFDSIKDPGGDFTAPTLLGVDFSGGVVLFNQFLYQIKKEHNRNNANMIILGTSGSGKSTAAKLLLRSNIRNNNQIVVIDPEGELEEMTSNFNGDFIMDENRLLSILKNAIVAYEFELEQQDYETEEELHKVVLNEFGMTENEYNHVFKSEE
jgi:hypothetical protein